MLFARSLLKLNVFLSVYEKDEMMGLLRIQNDILRKQIILLSIKIHFKFICVALLDFCVNI